MNPVELTKYMEQENDPTLDLVRKVRPYEIPKNYMRWEYLSAIIAISLRAYTNTQGVDRATHLCLVRTALWFVQDAPIFCMSSAILRAFEQTDIHESKDLLSELQVAMPTFILLFPENSIKSSEGGNIEYCVVHLSDINNKRRSEGSAYGFDVSYIPHEHNLNLHWSSVDSKETVWFSGCGLDNGNIQKAKDELGRDVANDLDKLFIKKMESIVLQSLLAIQYAPQLLEIEPSIVKSIRRPKQKQKEQIEIRRPRWIGKNYAIKSQKSSAVHSGQSPRMHWRRGHWKRVPVGKREENLRKRVWIEPVIVNAGRN
jgi:hypothetical protein